MQKTLHISLKTSTYTSDEIQSTWFCSPLAIYPAHVPRLSPLSCQIFFLSRPPKGASCAECSIRGRKRLRCLVQLIKKKVRQDYIKVGRWLVGELAPRPPPPPLPLSPLNLPQVYTEGSVRTRSSRPQQHIVTSNLVLKKPRALPWQRSFYLMRKSQLAM